MSTVQSIPSIPTRWIFQRSALQNPVQYFYRIMKEQGNIVWCKSITDFYLISHPNFAKIILQQNIKNLNKTDMISSRLRSVIGNGVVVSSGDLWKSQRQRAQVIFTKHELERFIPTIQKCSTELADQWRQKSSVNLHNEIPSHIMNVMMKCLFNEDDISLKAELAKAFPIGYAYIANTAVVQVPLWIPTAYNRNVKWAVQTIDKVLVNMQNNQQVTGKYNGTLLDYLMLYKTKDGNSLTQDEIVYEAKNILTAGHFSTTDLICWILYQLAVHPEWQQRIRMEHAQLNGHQGFSNALSLQHFVHEVMRIYPPVWSSWHKTSQEINVDGHKIAAGKTLMLSIFNIHRNPDYWDNPETFDPSRFERGIPTQAAFIPFGIGQRKCLGMGLAQLIINYTVTKIIESLELYIDQSQPQPEIQSRVTLGAKHDIIVKTKSLR